MRRTAETWPNCPVCKVGQVITRTTHEYFGDPMNMIIGPGYRNQTTEVTVHYCNACGVTYAFPPPANPVAPKPPVGMMQVAPEEYEPEPETENTVEDDDWIARAMGNQDQAKLPRPIDEARKPLRRKHRR